MAAKENFELVLAAFKLEDALGNARLRELSASDFERKFETLAGTLAGDIQNASRAVQLFAEEVEGVAYLDQLEEVRCT